MAVGCGLGRQGDAGWTLASASSIANHSGMPCALVGRIRPRPRDGLLGSVRTATTRSRLPSQSAARGARRGARGRVGSGPKGNPACRTASAWALHGTNWPWRSPRNRRSQDGQRFGLIDQQHDHCFECVLSVGWAEPARSALSDSVSKSARAFPSGPARPCVGPARPPPSPRVRRRRRSTSRSRSRLRAFLVAGADPPSRRRPRQRDATTR
jgi:hypothetical protein